MGLSHASVTITHYHENMSPVTNPYHAYLLRLHQVDNGGQPVWRISLQPVGSSNHLQFTSLPELNSFLQSICHPVMEDQLADDSQPT